MDNNVYIVSIEASSIVRAMQSKYQQVKSKDYMYKVAYPYSLDLIKLRDIAPKSFFVNGKIERTKAIINVEFNSSLYSYIYLYNKQYRAIDDKYGYRVTKDDTKRHRKLMNTQDLRNELYKNGFVMDGIHYVEFKRSGSKAKDGDHLFIDKRYLKEMIKFSRLNINISKNKKKKCDLTSIKAYEALTGSEISYTLKLKPEEILIVRDLKHGFVVGANVISLNENGNPYVHYEKNYNMVNDCFDGESLLDVSCFPQNEDGTMAGMQLLRAPLLKSCAFNCNLQAYLKNVDIVYNAFGMPQDAKKIKLVITPNSLKILKLKEHIKKDATNKEAYEYWIDNISEAKDKECIFGVVKSEHISTFGDGNYNRLSYQMINSIPLTETDIRKLVKTDFRYIMNLKKYISVFREHIKNTKICASADMIDNFLVADDDFQYVDLFKDYRNSIITHYKDKMKEGKVSIAGDYATICSMPYELMQSILYQETEEIFNEFKANLKPLQAKGEIYKSDLMENQRITIFRSPHICASNVIVGQMKSHDEFKTWFNFTKGIIVVTPWEWDIMERGNSLDFDSDSALCVKDSTILKRALQVQSFATPVHDIPKSKKDRYNTAESLADLDNQIAINKIGEIVNLSQCLNSYFWNEYYKGNKANKEVMKSIYDNVLVLAILSGIEIDKAKHTFDLEMTPILNKIRSMKVLIDGEYEDVFQTADMEIRKKYSKDEIEKIYELQEEILYLETFKDEEFIDENTINEEYTLSQYEEDYNNLLNSKKKELKSILNEVEKKKRVKRPYFFKYNQDGVYVWDETINCPMNYLINEIESNSLTVTYLNGKKQTPRLEFDKYLLNNEIDITKGLWRTQQAIYDIVKQYSTKKNALYRDKFRDKLLDNVFLRQYENEAIEKITKKNITRETMMRTIYPLYYKLKDAEDYKYKDLRKDKLTILGLLWKSQEYKSDDAFMSCLRLCANNRTELEPDRNGVIHLWGNRFSQNIYKITK